MEPRGIGNTDMFEKEGFNVTTLSKVPMVDRAEFKRGKSEDEKEIKFACRYPCPNCQAILPHLGIPVDSTLAAYNRDMNAANVSPA